jgi:GNAT superfamily N-acetyltransferase
MGARFGATSRAHPSGDGDMTQTAMPRLQAFTRGELDGAIELFAAAGWSTYTIDPEMTFRALSAPGSTTLVALEGATVVAVVQLQSDGEIQAHLSALLVARPWRRRGLGRELLREAVERAGGIRVDVLSRTGRFYASLGGQPRPGFRLTRQHLSLAEEPSGRSATRR